MDEHNETTAYIIHYMDEHNETTASIYIQCHMNKDCVNIVY